MHPSDSAASRRHLGVQGATASHCIRVQMELEAVPCRNAHGLERLYVRTQLILRGPAPLCPDSPNAQRAGAPLSPHPMSKPTRSLCASMPRYAGAWGASMSCAWLPSVSMMLCMRASQRVYVAIYTALLRPRACSTASRRKCLRFHPPSPLPGWLANSIPNGGFLVANIARHYGQIETRKVYKSAKATWH